MAQWCIGTYRVEGLQEVQIPTPWRPIDSCQNKVSADQYYLTVSRAQVSQTIHVEYFLKLSADKLLVFKWSQAQV